MTSKRHECKRCGIQGHVAAKCNKPAWWKRNDKPAQQKTEQPRGKQ
jgi:hypothetical protein